MRDFTSSALDNIGFSGIRAIFEKANRLEAAGQKVVHLEMGRLDFDTPTHIKEAAKKALDEGMVHYAPNLGLPVFRNAVRDFIKKTIGIDYADTEIIATIGATQGAFLTKAAFLEKGDEIIIPTPTFVSYLNAPLFFGAVAVPLHLKAEDGFQVDPDLLEKVITPRTKMLVLISPHNPTGAVLSMEVLERIAALAQKHDFLVLSDEVYDRMVYDGEKHISIASLPGMQERTILLNSFSKTYSMTGWRLGYIAAPEKLISPMIRTHQYVVGSANPFIQVAGAAALNEPQTCVDDMVKELSSRRSYLLKELDPRIVTAKPGGAFYFFLDMRPTGFTAEQFVDRMLDEGVALVPGSAFGAGGENFVRLAYAASVEDLAFAAEKIKKVLG